MPTCVCVFASPRKKNHQMPNRTFISFQPFPLGKWRKNLTERLQIAAALAALFLRLIDWFPKSVGKMVRKNWFMNRTRRKTLLNIVGTDEKLLLLAPTLIPAGWAKPTRTAVHFPPQEIDQLSEAQNKSLRFWPPGFRVVPREFSTTYLRSGGPSEKIGFPEYPKVWPLNLCKWPASRPATGPIGTIGIDFRKRFFFLRRSRNRYSNGVCVATWVGALYIVANFYPARISTCRARREPHFRIIFYVFGRKKTKKLVIT